MRLVVAVVGKARHPALSEAIRDYEQRAARYWPLDVHEVREERASGIPVEKVMQREGDRLAERIPPSAQRVACALGGKSLTSDRLLLASINHAGKRRHERTITLSITYFDVTTGQPLHVVNKSFKSEDEALRGMKDAIDNAITGQATASAGQTP